MIQLGKTDKIISVQECLFVRGELWLRVVASSGVTGVKSDFLGDKFIETHTAQYSNGDSYSNCLTHQRC